jgi:hypothetical protein
VRVGRDGQCELALQAGPTGVVSRNHACMEHRCREYPP